ncbi:hypothetical protein T439DRAFT_337650 [Meredithblackwellia eburnea MCA 4105]
MIVQALRGYSLGTTHQLDLYQDTLDQYCHLKGIKHLYAIAQTSQSSRNSLNRQQTLLSLLCPPPTTHEVITVDAESVFSVNTIAEQLQSIKNLWTGPKQPASLLLAFPTAAWSSRGSSLRLNDLAQQKRTPSPHPSCTLSPPFRQFQPYQPC